MIDVASLTTPNEIALAYRCDEISRPIAWSALRSVGVTDEQTEAILCWAMLTTNPDEPAFTDKTLIGIAGTEAFRSRVVWIYEIFAPMLGERMPSDQNIEALIIRPDLPSAKEIAMLSHLQQQGVMSTRRMASELNITIDGLDELFVAYGHPPTGL